VANGAQESARPSHPSLSQPQVFRNSELLENFEELDGSRKPLTEAFGLLGKGQSSATSKQHQGGFSRKSKNFLPVVQAQNPRNSLNSLSIMVF
jgi:hypothetical protein